ncbi:MAG: hypothetical protein KF681_04560 [Bdellovibrionaceae bacterium]|nr:hypothetical protein [Pseudobdellovibrionaceae bacterium]
MDEQYREQTESTASILHFPRTSVAQNLPPLLETKPEVRRIPTPQYDKLIAEAEKLDKKSKYPCKFDYTIYRDLETRYADRPIRGGVSYGKPLKLVNSHSTCQQCLYAFEMDTYGRGCAHDCVYCYARAQLTVHGYWNNPIPVPVDLNEVRKIFYTIFETQKPSKWRSIMEQRIPLRIGSMTDSFMFSDKKYKITQEVLRLLNYYQYPYIIFTRSDLIAHDEYLMLLDRKLTSVHMSISSINDELNRKIEPGAPSAKRRLAATQKLVEAGVWSTVRINPLFPIYPDGYFTDPDFVRSSNTPKFDFSSFEMVDAIADHKIPSFLAGFGRFSPYAMKSIEQATGVNLRPFFKKELVVGARLDWRFSDQEIRYYYSEYKRRAVTRGLQFTTCYIGNGEGHFWRDQDLWSNKKDCCNVKGKIASFNTDSRQVPFEERLAHSTSKCATPTSTRLHEPLGQAHLKLTSRQSTDGLGMEPTP